MLACATLWSTGGIFIQPIPWNPLVMAGWRCLISAAVGVPVLLLTNTEVSTASLLSILALGVIQLGIPCILLMLSSENCPPLACSLPSAAEPLLNPVWGETTGSFALAGGVVVIAWVTAWCVWQNKHFQPSMANA